MRAIRVVTVSAALVASVLPLEAVAQTTAGLEVTTPFPAVSVAPGEVVTFGLEVTAPGRQPVDLRVTQVPSGWRALLRGGGFVVEGVYTDPDDPPEVELEVAVPESADPGRHRIEVAGSSAIGADELVLDLRVVPAAAGRVVLEAEFPQLQGPAGGTYEFNVDLSNETPRETIFDLQAEGPPGWQVTVQPTGQDQASSVEVGPGETSSLTVTVDPADEATAGTYPIRIRAAGGGETAETELAVRIIGNFGIRVSTPDERLNVDTSAGDATEVPLVVVNDGSASLREVSLEGTTPSGWEVRFRPAAIAEIPPGQVVRAIAVLTPSEEAVAGDYMVTITAQTLETSDEIELRANVRTSPMWGLIGAALIVAALAGLALVFRVYGRR